jgi:hypothetical protein
MVKTNVSDVSQSYWFSSKDGKSLLHCYANPNRQPSECGSVTTMFSLAEGSWKSSGYSVVTGC